MAEMVEQAYIPAQNVVIAQPMQTTAVVVQQPVANAWGSGMCDCFEDTKSCCCVFFFPSCFFASIAQRMGEGCCVGFCGYSNGCVPGGHVGMRSYFRGKHNIQGSICDDSTSASSCLVMCTMCQLSREMDRLNYPPGCC